MAERTTRWEVGEDDDLVVIEVVDGRVRISIPSGKPIAASPPLAERVRTVLGIAIGEARCEPAA